MDEPIKIQVQTTFRMAYKALLRLITLRPSTMISSAIFPLAGLSIIGLHASRHQWPPAGLWPLILLAFGFTPLILALSLFMARRRSVVAKGPVAYVFDRDGIQTSTPVSNSHLRWGAIVRAVETGSFLFIFVSASAALYIPMTQFGGDDLSRLRALLKDHVTDLKGPAW